jgi:predicted transcriptional regulator of viral defense system
MYPKVASTKKTPFRQQQAVFRAWGGTLRMSEAIRLGVSRRSLYAMRDAGVLEQVSRGLYRLRGMPLPANPDLVTIAKRVRQGVVCLISALAYHELTTQVPHEVYVALEKGAEAPRVAHPPLRLFWFSGPAFTEGVELRKVDGVPLRVYTPEKTIADCFKFRNKLGMDVVLEALKLWRERRSRHTQTLLLHARHCRVERIIRPYLEALL